MRTVIVVLLVVACCLTASAAVGTPGAPRVDCPALATMDFSHVPDAPSHLDTAHLVTNGNLAFCQVEGFIAPRTHFVVKLPTQHWRGQFLEQGCGGLCGRIPGEVLGATPQGAAGCAPVTNGELVLAGDDEGHAASSDTDGRWGTDPALRRVYGLTSEHSLANLAKAVITRYYGRGPSHSYYDGCSDGGREALMLAQRYPADFDGVVAGAPGSNMAPLLGLSLPWLARVNTDRRGHQILDTGKLPALHRAVLAACGAGGVIADPRRCAFDPAAIACAPGTDTPSCLTPAQVGTVRAAYRGPADRTGRSLFNGGEPYGSELGWVNWFSKPATDPAAPGDGFAARIGLNYLTYLALPHNPPAGFTLRDLRFTDDEFAALDTLGRSLYNANDPDLSAFRARGGKLLIYHGWADQAISPWSTLDYYAALERTAGGYRASQRFSRLYLVPGMYHCGSGPDTWAPAETVRADFLTPVIDWVEHARPPAAIRAPIVRLPDNTPLHEQTVHPADATAAVPTAPGSLNGPYHYVGHY